ncbi:MAG: transketolase family protein [Leptospiraceae bacterium]|nr:transketolase family protein [Leptospiraceae bacterium]MDW8306020.1 transketolase family protein [Leptospiraceae bacterium]
MRVLQINFEKLGGEKKATRDGYGDALVELGAKYEKLVVLDADLSGSTKTNKFAKKFPERFFNFGVAEQNLVGQAAGLAMAGFTPFASSFAIFLTGRAWEIVRNTVVYPQLNVKLAATHAGITLGEDGASHQIIEDIALMRVIPGMKVVVPADYWQAYHAVEKVFLENGPVYLRLGRPAIPVVYPPQYEFCFGESELLKTGQDYLFVACGVMVYEALKAALLLEKQKNVSIAVLNMATIKPLDEEGLLEASQKAKAIFTFEEHSTYGGLGGAVSEFFAQKKPMPVYRFGLKDVFGQSGSADELMAYYRLKGEQLAEDIASLL